VSKVHSCKLLEVNQGDYLYQRVINRLLTPYNGKQCWMCSKVVDSLAHWQNLSFYKSSHLLWTKHVSNNNIAHQTNYLHRTTMQYTHAKICLLFYHSVHLQEYRITKNAADETA